MTPNNTNNNKKFNYQWTKHKYVHKQTNEVVPENQLRKYLADKFNVLDETVSNKYVLEQFHKYRTGQPYFKF